MRQLLVLLLSLLPCTGLVELRAAEPLWCLREVQSQEIPRVRDATWPRSKIDYFILDQLEREGLRPAPGADKRTLLRRLSFDLVGLPPTRDEIHAFLADDSPEALAKVVDRLLASPHYGQRFGRHWLDVVRYADARDLIQLPKESDFREAWRYRDWVVEAFQRDLPYDRFLTLQLCGDLLQPQDPNLIDAEALVATGFLALADFVPGDVDKDLMIADYVNDQIDVVGRALLGLTLACARCHDHKFDPISMDDYYALAGIFFSTRLIPKPVLGNTPLVRVPLLPRAELERRRQQSEADQRRLAELEPELKFGLQREFERHLREQVANQTESYLLAAWKVHHARQAGEALDIAQLAQAETLQVAVIERWIAYLFGDLTKTEPPGVAIHRVPGSALDPLLPTLRQSLADDAQRRTVELAVHALCAELSRRLLGQDTPMTTDAHSKEPGVAGCAIALCAANANLLVDEQERVLVWPNQGSWGRQAQPVAGVTAPLRTSLLVAGVMQPVLQFEGNLLEIQADAPGEGSLVLVWKPGPDSQPGERLIGWEDSSVGQHGLGISPQAGGGLMAILRHRGASGDLSDSTSAASELEITTVTWGPRGTTLHRNGMPRGASTSIQAISSDPQILALSLGGPGSGGGARFHGYIAEARVHDRQLDDAARMAVEQELAAKWSSGQPATSAAADPWARWICELQSEFGPYGRPLESGQDSLPPAAAERLAALKAEIETLRNRPSMEIPQGVVVLDGGPEESRHAGFHDSAIFLRGDPHQLGAVVPRGFPKSLTWEGAPTLDPANLQTSSGRKELAAWITSPRNPLTARVIVNRIWQHHFGDGLVRSSTNFGELGDRPSHPELLDFLASEFVRGGWSVKALQRLIVLSSAYQQSCETSDEGLMRDPENRLLGRMTRRRLEAETIRDGLLAIAGNLDRTPGGPAFQDLSLPRRTLYFMSVRTGEQGSSFRALFDCPDPGAIVERRAASTVAPQALFLLNDEFIRRQADLLAQRVTREAENADPPTRVTMLFEMALGRQPSPDELEIAQNLLRSTSEEEGWRRLCHVLICTNEFIYID